MKIYQVRFSRSDNLQGRKGIHRMQLQKKLIGKAWALISMITVFTCMNIGISFSQVSTTTGAQTPAVQNNDAVKPVATKTSSADLYAKDPETLAPVQCGQCHTEIYQDLKKNGGRHKMVCQYCHKNIHTYNPEKRNWQDLMPKCSNCHT